ncbi:MAG: efflux RND transporter periplasmic adaptor subunit [Pirellulales bacterium]
MKTAVDSVHNLLSILIMAAAVQAISLTASSPAAAAGLELEGFTEPFRTINIASDESGIIDEMLVREGEKVEQGQPLARLNSDVHRTLLAIAEQGMQAEGRLDAALADQQLRQDRLRKLESLRAEGHARQEELDRAATEVAVAEANVRAAREDRLTKKLEYDRIKVQYERRTVRAPVAGVVTKMHKQMGEFVAPNNPDVLTLVQLDPLMANFTILSDQSPMLAEGQKVTIRLVARDGQEVAGIVDFVAPTTDAESGTVLVKIRIENAEGRIRSGERCKLQP